MLHRKTVLHALVLVALLGACSTPRVRFLPRISVLKFDGTVASDTSGSPLTDNDVRDDLGIDGTENEFGARADLEFVRNTLTLNWSPASFAGDGTLAGQLSKDGVTLPAGTNVATSIDFDMLSGIWTYDFVPGDDFDLGLGLGAHLFDFESKMRSTDVGTPGTIDLDESVLVPVLAARGVARLGRFDFSALVSGMEYSGGDDDARLFDLDFMARWQVPGDGRFQAAITAGWRRTDVSLDYTDGGDHTKADLGVAGFYYGLTFSF